MVTDGLWEERREGPSRQSRRREGGQYAQRSERAWRSVRSDVAASWRVSSASHGGNESRSFHVGVAGMGLIRGEIWSGQIFKRQLWKWYRTP